MGETYETRNNLFILSITGESDVLFWIYGPFRSSAITYDFGYQLLKSFSGIIIYLFIAVLQMETRFHNFPRC